MSRYIDEFFQRTDSYITSPFGGRTHPVTGEYSFHRGNDYGTHLENWPIYALEEGYIKASNSDDTNGNYIWVVFPRINRRFFLGHLDSRTVAKDELVEKGTLLGYVGSTGRSTAIHLHLGMKILDTDVYADQELEEYFPLEEVMEEVIEDVAEEEHQLKLSEFNERALQRRQTLRRKDMKKAKELLRGK